jgi:hypothetical protein
VPTSLEDSLAPSQLDLLSDLSTPIAIQAFLDEVPYSAEDANRCPLRVIQDRQAHCLDGALFAAAALRRLGHPALIVDLLPEPGADDDHVLAIYRLDGCFGAIAKSNFSGLRFREAIHRSLRELALSYFEDFYNIHGDKTLRAYTRPLDLSAFDGLGWEWRDEGANAIERRLARLRPVSLLTPEMAARLSPLDRRSYEAGMLGANPAGLYKPQAR